MANAAQPYDKIRGSLDTGDVVLFDGTGFISKMIKVFTDSPWSHVGMVYRDSAMNAVYLWESTSISKTKDISGTYRQGVQTVFLEQRLKDFPGRVAVRHLEIDRTPEMLDLLGRFRQECKGKPYETRLLELAASAIDCGIELVSRENLTSLFCSELLAAAWQRMRLLNCTTPSNEYVPGDWGTGGAAEHGMIAGSLGPEILVCACEGMSHEANCRHRFGG